MDDAKPGGPQAVKDLKVSVVAGDTAVLQASGLLGLPPRPGVLGTLGSYELLECVGEGGMGVVFRARDTRSGKEVAIKLLKPALASHERAVAYFVKEACHLQGLTHPHIVPVFDYVQTASGTYFVMPYLPGGSLERLLRSGRPLDSARALSMARQVASALALAHSRSIIHRDLKPRNILLDDQGQALPGFEAEKCVLRDEDRRDIPLKWGDASVRQFAGKTIRLRFFLRSANIYAVTSNPAP